MALYKLTKTGEGFPACVKKNVGTNQSIIIPLNAPGNSDYIEYQAWVDAGNIYKKLYGPSTATCTCLRATSCV